MSWVRRVPRTPMSPARRRFELALALIALAVLGTLVLVREANIETVLVASLVAGALLGRWYSVAVPLVAMAILQPLLWGSVYPGYGLGAMVGLTFFLVTGFLFVGLAGRALKPRIVFRTGAIALLTTVSVPLTIAYDLWTDVGVWLLFAGPAGMSFWTVLELQVPFTLYHLLSSLIFVPLFGAIFLVADRALSPAPNLPPAPQEEGGP